MRNVNPGLLKPEHPALYIPVTGFGVIRVTSLGPHQSSTSSSTTRREAFSIASLLSAQINGSNPAKCPSLPTV
jgi:hypothetical protein